MRKLTPMHGRVVEALRSANLQVVAKDTKIPRPTLKKYLYGEIENPGVRWIEILDKYFSLRRRAA